MSPRLTPQQQADRDTATARRVRAQLLAIKASQRQLQMDDDTYRDMLQRLTTRYDATGQVLEPGKRSATELTLAEGGKVLDYLRRQGAVNPKQPNRTGGKRRPTVAPEKAEMMAKIHALLTALGEATGEPHGMGYADAICRRNGWADAVDFCRPVDLHLVIGALSRTLRHKQAAAAAAQ